MFELRNTACLFTFLGHGFFLTFLDLDGALKIVV